MADATAFNRKEEVGEMNMDHEVRARVLKEARRIEEDALYTYKAHYNTSDKFSRWHYRVGILSVVASSLSPLPCFQDWNWLLIIFAVIAAVSAGILTFVKPDENSALHKKFAGQYHTLRNDIQVFCEVELTGLTEEDATLRLKEFNDRRNQLNEEAPTCGRRSYEKAKYDIEDLKTNEYEVDKK